MWVFVRRTRRGSRRNASVTNLTQPVVCGLRPTGMSRVIVGAAAAVIIACAGCASTSQVGTGAGTAAPGGSVTGTSPASPVGSALPGPSIAPTGPVATAARGTPPPAGKQAVAHVGGQAISCPTESLTTGGGPDRSPLPSDFTITKVVRCETVLRAYGDLGEWSVQLAEVADSPSAALATLATELRRPSEPTPSGIACPSIAMVMPWFALIDDHGKVVQPALPTDKCGLPLPGATKALSSLDFSAVDAVRVAQTRAPEAIKTGCDQQWKDMVALEGAKHPQGLAGSSVGDLASTPSSVLVCLYKAGPLEGGLRAGDLIKGATLDGDAAAALASAAAITGPLAASCADAGEFAVIGGAAYVELGGCNRLLTNDGRVGAASAALLAQLKAALGLS